MVGFTQTDDVLTRSFDPVVHTSGLDALIQACTDIRVGPAYGKATVIALNPQTWDVLKRTKTQSDAFVLSMVSPNELGALDNLFGVPVVENTMIPTNIAVVADMPSAARYFVRQALTIDVNYWGDTQWTTNSVSFRAEMRSTLAVLRPKAICIVDYLPYGDGS